jgi:hypothetical protein
VKVLPERFLCRSHWFMVPAHLRSEVWRAYNQYRDAKGYDRNRIENLREAQKNALDAVEAKLKGVPV